MTASDTSGDSLYELYVQPALGEMIGTALFVLFVNLASAPSAVRATSYALISALSLYVIRGFFRNIHRGYFNPAVSISQLLIRRLDAASAVAFVAVQFFGAFLGAAVFRALMTDVLFLDYSYGTVIVLDEPNTITRSQGFFLEIILSSVICLAYFYADGDDDNLRISSCWGITSFFSISLIGQAGNLSLSTANALVYYLFTNDPTPTAYLYLNASAALISTAVSAGIWWLLRARTRQLPLKSPTSDVGSKADLTA
ncbi:hypothetical protein Q1695_011178 [Nippostrongylus brasiliensis]|nr:hypothetical protein Q1695_011178 [Nippostrongylus brasiliensis]